MNERMSIGVDSPTSLATDSPGTYQRPLQDFLASQGRGAKAPSPHHRQQQHLLRGRRHMPHMPHMQGAGGVLTVALAAARAKRMRSLSKMA